MKCRPLLLIALLLAVCPLLADALAPSAPHVHAVWAQADGIDDPKSVQTLQADEHNVRARQLAHERFHFMHWYESRFGDGMIYTSDFMNCTLLFPFGRADRAYVLCLPGGDVGGTDGKYLVRCYQEQDGAGRADGYRIVYSVDMIPRDLLAPRGQRVPLQEQMLPRSLLDYLTQEISDQEDGVLHIPSYALAGRVSRYARRDLALRRDYAVYARDMVDCLHVYLLLESHDNEYSGATYGLTFDPFTGSKLGYLDRHGTTTDRFYWMYGLPITQEELAQIGQARRNAAPTLSSSKTWRRSVFLTFMSNIPLISMLF